MGFKTEILADRRTQFAGLLALCLGLAAPCLAQRESEFLSVKSWQGSLKVKANHTGTGSAGGASDSWNLQWSAELQFKLDEFSSAGQFWRGKFVGGSVAVGLQHVLTTGGCTMTSTVVGQGVPANPEIFLLVGPGNNYSLHVTDPGIPSRITVTTVCPNQTGTLTNDRPEAWFPMNPGRHDKFPLPATGLDLIGGGKFPMARPFPFLLSAPAVFPADVSWEFRGPSSPLEVVIEPEGYDNWRPKAGVDEATPGNDIPVKATLRHEDGSALSAIEKAQKFEFLLAKVSREPGTTMNYPVAVKAKKTPDLQFDKARQRNLPIIVPGQDRAESTGLPHETATAIVSAYDWGAWGVIKVTAVTLDGRRIEGYLKDDKPQKDVRLPKREESSKIADAWKKSKGISKPDDDDSEDTPEGDSHLGDGLVLYEEYRGFQENGRHIEGDPKRKDYFIWDQMPGAKAGILLFESISGLKVHHRLKFDERDADRLINANHTEAPHSVDQHLVEMQPGLWNGVSKAVGGPGVPRQIEFVGIATMDRWRTYQGSSLGATPWTGTRGRVITDYIAATVAHELLHACNVWHHGASDKGTVEWFQDGNGDIFEGGARIDARDEGGAAWIIGLNASQQKWLAGQQGQHSGVEDCVMRYDVAKAYLPSAGGTNLRYAFDDKEQTGIQLCATAQGSGVNAAGRTPRPRYGDAAKGNCKKQLCVNDRYSHP